MSSQSALVYKADTRQLSTF